MTTITKLHFNGVDYDIGGGRALASPTNLGLSLSGTTATLTWTDPADSTDKTYPKLSWVKSVLVKKTGSYPANPSDGTVVVTETTRNQYSSSGYVDTSSGDTYFYRVFALSSQGIYSYENFPAHPSIDYLSAVINTGTTVWNNQYNQRYMTKNGQYVFTIYYSGDIKRQSLPTNYDASSITGNQSYSLGQGNSRGLALNDTGTKLYIGVNGDKKIYQYTLSTAYVPSTATLSHQTAAFEAEVDFILFNWDGTKVFVILDNSKLGVATLSSAWDLSTMGALTTTDISSYLYSGAQVYRMAMFLSDLEDKLFLTDGYKTLYQFSIDNGDVTNIQLVNQYEFNNDQITYGAVYPNNDGNYRFYRFDGSNPSKIYQHTL